MSVAVCGCGCVRGRGCGCVGVAVCMGVAVCGHGCGRGCVCMAVCVRGCAPGRGCVWTLTLLRCFHSSAHSRSVSLWSITSSCRDPGTTVDGGGARLGPTHSQSLPYSPRPRPLLPGPTHGLCPLGTMDRVTEGLVDLVTMEDAWVTEPPGALGRLLFPCNTAHTSKGGFSLSPILQLRKLRLVKRMCLPVVTRQGAVGVGCGPRLAGAGAVSSATAREDFVRLSVA